jgi:hypothetical protein
MFADSVQIWSHSWGIDLQAVALTKVFGRNGLRSFEPQKAPSRRPVD